MAVWHWHHDLEGLAAIQRELSALLQREGVDARTVYGCELVLDEWLANIRRHGGQAARRRPVTITLTLQATDIALVFEDSGPAFDPVAATPPEPATSLAEARPGGLGLRLIGRTASDWRHERLADGNRLTVRVARRQV